MKKQTIHWLVMLSALMVFRGSAAFAQDEAIHAPLTIDDAVYLALKNSSLIRQAIDAIAIQEDAEKSVRADLFPSVSAKYQYMRLKEAPFVIFQNQQFDLNGVNEIHWDVSLRQPLFAGFALVTRHEMEKLGIDVKTEEKRQAILMVVKNVKTAYFNILLAKQFQKTADEAVDQLAAHTDDAKRFYDQGFVAYNDVLKSQVALSDARQKAATAKSRVEMALSTFNVLVSLPFENKSEVANVTVLPPVPKSINPLIAEAIEARPVIQALRLTAKQADLAVLEAKSAYYPYISLMGTYEQNGQNSTASYNDFGNWHNAGVSIVAQWNLIDWGKRHADVNRRISEKDALEAKMNMIEDDIRLEVKQAYLDLTVADQNIHTAEQTLDQAKEYYRITNAQYQENFASSIDVIDARTDLTRAESNYYSTLYGYQIAAADLDQAVGKMAEPGLKKTTKEDNPLSAEQAAP